MRPTKNIENLIKNVEMDTNVNTDEAVLGDVIEAFEKSKVKKTSAIEQNIWRIIMKSKITKLAAAVAIIVAVFVGIHYLGSSGTSVAFAEVIQQFESVPFFNLTIYVGNDTTAEAQKIEIWKSENSEIRAHEGNKIIFGDLADGNSVFVAFDRSTLQPADANGIAKAVLLWVLRVKGGRFSLENITNSLPSEPVDITPIQTSDNASSKETIIFEAKHKTRPQQWLLIWALRESKLPFRMYFNSHSKYSDYLFDYSQKKDSAFFDSNAFTKQRDR